MSRHEVGLSLSFPFGDRVAVGGTARYLRLERETAGAVQEKNTGFTFDAGITVRPIDRLSFGFCGYGLKDMEDPQAPSGFGGGVALVPVPELVIAADAVLDRRTYVPGAGKAITYSGGAEYTWAAKFAVRGGGGRDGLREAGFGTLGFTALTESGAIDIGGRMDLGGSEKAYVVAASLRLFVPTP
jgi:hypothetical protein